jgi:hypothetical protein
MELAGLACAQTLAKVYNVEEYKRVLVIAGPGNQVSIRWLRNLDNELGTQNRWFIYREEMDW